MGLQIATRSQVWFTQSPLTHTDITCSNPPRRKRHSITGKEVVVSVIIPCKTLDAYTEECISYCLKMECANYEIIVLPDHYDTTKIVDGSVRIVPTGSMKPMSKRFLGSSLSKGTLCAFIDSDAYPVKNWIEKAIRHFKDSEVAAVVGPSQSPSDDDLMSKASEFVLSSPFGGGSEAIRYGGKNSHIKYVSEAPTCNFVIRNSVLHVVKDSVRDVWPGEEIVLCGLVTKDLKKKIIYDPSVVVYHHRRRLFSPHLSQVWKYGAVKGYLWKKHSQYVRPIFLLPSLFVLGVVGGFPLAMMNPVIRSVYVLLLLAYFFLLLGNSVFVGLREKNVKMTFLVFAGTVLTHLCYGLAFIKGIFSRKPTE